MFEKFLKRGLKKLVRLIYDYRSILFFFERNKKICKSVTFSVFRHDNLSILAVVCALSKLESGLLATFGGSCIQNRLIGLVKAQYFLPILF